jgi:uncharacterized protein (TIGR04222 family)
LEVELMRDHTELGPYEIAYLCGGPERVAMTVLVGLAGDGRIRVSPDRHRVYAERREPRDPVETAALEVVPKVGRVLGLTVLMIAASPAVEEVGRRLRAERLLPGSRVRALWQWGRVRRVRRLRRALDRPLSLGAPSRVAATGAAGIADRELRTIFETHTWEPPVSIDLSLPKPRVNEPLPEVPYRSGLYSVYSDFGGY